MTPSRVSWLCDKPLMGVLILSLLLVSACQVDGELVDGVDETAETTETEESAEPPSDGQQAGVVEFSTWAEDEFERDAYLEAVDRFVSETGIEIDLDMTVNEIGLEELGR